MEQHHHNQHFVRNAADKRSAGQGRFSMGRSFSCAWHGIAYAFTSQRNLKIHLVFACLALVLGLVLHISSTEWCAVVLCIMIVMALEVVNTAIESVVDLVQPTWHDLAMHAKDCAAGAVYLAALGSLIVAALVFGPPLIRLICML